MKVSIVQCHRMNGGHVEERELHFAKLLHKLQECEVEISVLTVGSDSDVITLNDSGVCIRYFPVGVASAKNSEQKCDLLVDFYRKTNADLLLFKGLGYGIMTDVLDVLGKNVLTGVIIGGKVLHPSILRLDLILCELPYQVEMIRARFPEARAKSFVLPKLIRWDFVSRYASSAKIYDVCNIGQVCERKNQILLASLSSSYSIAFAGGGDISGINKDFPSDSKAVFLGQLNRKSVYEIISSSKLNAHVSLYEGVPRAVIESFSCGLPLVGLQDTLMNAFGELPFVNLVPPSDVNLSCEALLNSPEELEEQSALAQQWAIQNFSDVSFSRVVERLFSVLSCH